MTRTSTALLIGSLSLLPGCPSSISSSSDTSADGASPADAGASSTTCVPGAICGMEAATCIDGGMRCTCETGSSLHWACEPAVCPAVDGRHGEACDVVGTTCDGGFEDPGRRCVGPENVWADCLYFHRGGTFGPPNGCPAEPPTVGTPCCQGLRFGGPPPGCDYDGELYDCVGDHWARSGE